MSVDIQRQVELDGIPDDEQLQTYAAAALADLESVGICLRIVDEAEGRALNLQWRGKDYATNVLSFPGSAPPGLPPDEASALSGDIVLCAPVIAREADVQSRPLAHHWAHLVIHGLLHLQGFDHIEEASAAEMEDRERRLLVDLGIPDPYREA